MRFDGSTKNGCILSKFYIKPQPLLSTSKRSLSCILSKFYIKPQQLTPYRQPGEVVSYRNSTSNHNFLLDDFCAIAVVSYRNSTSNHNSRRILLPATIVVSYRNSTSNHNTGAKLMKDSKLYLIEILHQTTTFPPAAPRVVLLYLIEILHQTTTCGKCEDCLRRCILSKFYIKPQRAHKPICRPPSCILSKFYIKPQLPE